MNRLTLFVLLAALLLPSLIAAERSGVPSAPTPAKTKGTPPAKKPAYELPKTGVNRPRPNGGWINVETSGTRLLVKFYDKQKKPVAPDVQKGLAIFKYASRNPARAPLSKDNTGMATPAVLRPPHNFLLILSFFAGDQSEAAESYTLQYP